MEGGGEGFVWRETPPEFPHLPPSPLSSHARPGARFLQPRGLAPRKLPIRLFPAGLAEGCFKHRAGAEFRRMEPNKRPASLRQGLVWPPAGYQTRPRGLFLFSCTGRCFF